MVEDLKNIQSKLDLAQAALTGISSLLETVAGRADMSETMAKQLLAKGKRVPI